MSHSQDDLDRTSDPELVGRNPGKPGSCPISRHPFQNYLTVPPAQVSAADGQAHRVTSLPSPDLRRLVTVGFSTNDFAVRRRHADVGRRPACGFHGGPLFRRSGRPQSVTVTNYYVPPGHSLVGMNADIDVPSGVRMVRSGVTGGRGDGC